MLENENCILLWDSTIQCDRMVKARRPDIVFMDKKKTEIKILDMAVPGDGRVKDKELEKIEKYQALKEEVGRIWGTKKLKEILIVIGALVAISDEFDKHTEEIGVKITIQEMQRTALLGTARILWNECKWVTRFFQVTASMRLELNMKISRPAGATWHSSMGPVVIKLLLQ